MEYECNLKVVYTPETAFSKGNHEYTLLETAEVGNGRDVKTVVFSLIYFVKIIFDDETDQVRKF